MSREQASSVRGERKRSPRLPYLPGLDGLRALAVIAVLLYHAGLSTMQGGFLGVEIFFVISGYLISSLLLAEWRHTGRIDLKGFWLRRARRLLPALYVLLLAVLAVAVFFLPEEVAGLRRDALAAGGYATNWYLILSHKSYFEAVGRPPLLQHLWSLAVEEQFYLLWPLLLTLGLRRLRQRPLLAVILAGAVASSIRMGVLYQPDVDPSRVYYGTDTRAAGLLLGAALAFLWAPGGTRRDLRVPVDADGQLRTLPPLATRWLDVCGGLALVGLLACCIFVNEYDALLYRGGFVLVALLTLVVIAAAVQAQGRLGRTLLGWAPLRWVGTRSYGIYLWHWPVFMVTRPQLDVALDGLPLLALRFIATFALSELSYRLVEVPIRTGALGRAWGALHQAHGRRRYLLGLRWGIGVAAFAVFCAVIGGSVVAAQPPPPPAYLAVQAVDTLAEPGADAASDQPGPPAAAPATGSTVTVTVAGPTAAAPMANPAWAGQLRPTAGAAGAGYATTPASTVPHTQPAVPTAPPEASVARPTALPTPAPAVALTTTATAVSPVVPTAVLQPPAVSVTTAVTTTVRVGQASAFGDSVMLGAVSDMRKTIAGLDVDAAQGRQVSGALQLLAARKAAGQLAPVVLIHLGTNGTFSARQFDQMMEILAGAQRVIFVNDKVARQWESANNTVLSEGVKRYPNARLIDWRSASSDHPEYFWGDGIHLRPEGAQVYTDLIAAALKAP